MIEKKKLSTPQMIGWIPHGLCPATRRNDAVRT